MNISPDASLSEESMLLAKLRVAEETLFNPKILWLGHMCHHGMAEFVFISFSS